MEQFVWEPGTYFDEETRDGVITKLVLPKNTRSPNNLQYPPKKDRISEEKPCLHYTAFVKQRKRVVALLEGDDAETQLARFHDKFLTHYFEDAPPTTCKRPRTGAAPPSQYDSTAGNSDQSPGASSEAQVAAQARNNPDDTRTLISTSSEVQSTSQTCDKPDVQSAHPEYDLLHGWGLQDHLAGIRRCRHRTMQFRNVSPSPSRST